MDLITGAYIVGGMTAFALAVELGTIANDEWHWRKFRRAMRADRKRRNAERPARVIDSPNFRAAIAASRAQLAQTPQAPQTDAASRYAQTAPHIAATIQQARPALPVQTARPAPLILKNPTKGPRA